jgi:hypothetical protein
LFGKSSMIEGFHDLLDLSKLFQNIFIRKWLVPVYRCQSFGLKFTDPFFCLIQLALVLAHFKSGLVSFVSVADQVGMFLVYDRSAKWTSSLPMLMILKRSPILIRVDFAGILRTMPLRIVLTNTCVFRDLIITPGVSAIGGSSGILLSCVGHCARIVGLNMLLSFPPIVRIHLHTFGLRLLAFRFASTVRRCCLLAGIPRCAL